jgi:hypothetical protein
MTTDIKSFLQSLLDPQPVDSFFSKSIPSGILTIEVLDTPGEQLKRITLEDIYPFSTLLDIKLAIYNKYKRSDNAHPNFVFLGRVRTEETPTQQIEPVDYNWSISITPSKNVLLNDPIDSILKKVPVDSNFVDSVGNRKEVRRTNMERTTFEEKFSLSGEPNSLPKLRAYFYTALEQMIPGQRPIGEIDWNGRLYPYFPTLSVSSRVITEAQKNQAKKIADNFIVRSLFFKRLETIITTSQTIKAPSISAIQFLLLSFTKPVKIPGVEVLFYKIHVDQRKPYMRLIPVQNTPISKIHMLPNNEPNLEDPRLLYSWSQEKNPTPERDFLMVKILLKKLSGDTVPFYSTMRVLDDGTADITIEPPKPLKKLNPETDLKTLGDSLQDALSSFTYLNEAPVLKKGFFIFVIDLKGVIHEPYTTLSLRKKLPLFASIFQEIPPAEGISPVIMLRYKLVSNFNREDRYQQFITQYCTLNPIQKESDLATLISAVIKEFQISSDDAREEVAKNLEKKSEIILVNPETKDYSMYNNPGIDIAIYAKHPTYYFHIHRADSLESIQRIISCLSILFCALDNEIKVTEEEMLRFKTGDDEFERRENENDANNNFKSIENDREGAEEAPEGAEEAPEAAEEAPEGAEEAPEAAEEAPEGAEEAPEGAEESDYFKNFVIEEEDGPDAETLKESNNNPPVPEVTVDAGQTAQPGRFIVKRPLQKLEGEIVGEPFAEGEPLSDKKKPGLRGRLQNALSYSAVQAPEAAAIAKQKPITHYKSLDTYFSERLQETDRKLFDYHKTNPQLRGYVSQCGANLSRQPASLTPEQLERMKDEYKEELDKGTMRFYIFPLEKDAKKHPYDANPAKMEYYTIMRYGSSPSNQNYYLCSRYFCVRDEMLVREVEFRQTNLRKNHYVRRVDGNLRKTKEPNTCPMCEGKLVQNKKNPGVNETVMERVVKAGTAESRQIYIGFLKKTEHPDGLYLPCCTQVDQPRRIGDPQFPEPSQDIFAAREAVRAIGPVEDTGAPSVQAEEIVQKITISYEETILQARTAYISGMEKIPLDPALRRFKKVRKDKTGAFIEEGDLGRLVENSPPQIGLLPPELNEYFSQNPIELVTRTGNQKLVPNSKGFLRIGVENRNRADSFLAAVAPFFRFNSVADLKDALNDIIQPRLFLGLNFGNLMLEMYDPTWIPRILKHTGEPPTDNELKEWAKSDLKVRRSHENEDYILRAYLSYDKFIWWLLSDKTDKHYRHFAHFFSLPGIMNVGVRKYALTGATFREFRRPGMLFIVLEILKTGELKVRCAPYPIGNENFLRTDIGFLLKDPNGNWEPIFYYNNNALSEDETNQAQFSFSISQKGSWPKEVTERLEEYRTMCSTRSGGLGIYTSSLGLNSRKVVPLLRVKNVLDKYEDITLIGLLRDSYNHVAALVYQNEMGEKVAVPVIEDGISYSYHQDVPERMSDEERPQLTLVLDVKIILDWDDYIAAPLNQVVRFYKKYVEPHFPELYTVQRSVKSKGTGEIVAVQLSNGLYIPAKPLEKGQNVPEFPDKDSPKEIHEMEWAINKQIIVESTTPLEDILKSDEISTKNFTESFEHLRITFSNWLNSAEGGGNFRRELHGIIVNRNLPLFEKRKRIAIKITPLIEKWITDIDEEAPRQASLLRVDCYGRKKEECNNTCKWVEDTESTEHSCRIHVRKSEGDERMSAANIMMYRLIDELIRFGNRRREIFEKRVSQLAIIDDPIRIGDQYIIPEKSVIWTEMLRMEWTKKTEETPVYLEEMRREITEADKNPPAPVTEITALPKNIEDWLGKTDPATARLRMYPSPTGTLKPLLTLFKVTPNLLGLAEDAKELTKDALKNLVKRARLPVLQYDIRKEINPQTNPIGVQIARDQEIGYAIFVVGETGPSILVTDVEAPALLNRAELPEKFKEYLEKPLKMGANNSKVYPVSKIFAPGV